MAASPAGSDPTSRQRLLAVAVTVLLVSVVGFVLALVFDWPSRFTLEESPDGEVTPGDIVNGTVTSIPLAPFVVLALCTLLSGSRQWWGTVGTVVLTVLGLVFVVGGLGEITSENPDVPSAVLVAAGVLYVLLGLALFVSGVLALLARWRSRQR